MKYPTIIVDNFFDNPDEIREFSNKLKWIRSDKIVGYRTLDLGGLINEDAEVKDFFHFIGHKILLLLHPYNTNEIRYNAELFFQKQIPGKSHLDGWVHKDKAEVSAIIYLNNTDTYGTNIYKRKKQWNRGVSLRTDNYSKKHKGFFDCENKEFDEQEFLDEREKNNKDFDLITNVKGIKNRILLFDSSQYHAMEIPSIEDNSDRLILMMWFNDIQLDGMKNGVIESRRFVI